MADIERAWTHLPLNSLGWRIIGARMQGHTPSQFARIYHLRKTDVLQAYKMALVEMAAFLEGVEI